MKSDLALKIVLAIGALTALISAVAMIAGLIIGLVAVFSPAS